MNFIVRPAREDDLNDLFDLAKQFALLNLPADKKVITKKIEKSIASFSCDIPPEQAVYLFVVEDLENGWLAGCSQIKAKHGTVANPTYSFKILKKERFSRDLGVGFIHQILRMRVTTDGPTEVGGLVVAKSYRQRPEKVGRLVSLARFLYIGMHRDLFEDELHSEMAPPLTDEGRSEFWEALGRRFTGMPYYEADALSHTHKEFIQSLFPEEDIYLCLLDAKARLVLGRVGEETRPALHMLEKLGFKYKEEVDPFDGGPHLGVATDQVSIIKNSKKATVAHDKSMEFEDMGLVGLEKDKGFVCGGTYYALEGKKIYLPKKTIKALELEVGDEVFLAGTESSSKHKNGD